MADHVLTVSFRSLFCSLRVRCELNLSKNVCDARRQTCCPRMRLRSTANGSPMTCHERAQLGSVASRLSLWQHCFQPKRVCITLTWQETLTVEWLENMHAQECGDNLAIVHGNNDVTDLHGAITLGCTTADLQKSQTSHTDHPF